MNKPRIFPLSTDALTVEFGNEISEKLNRRAVNLSRYFEENRFNGFIETFPAYASLTIFYDLYKVKKAFPAFSTAFAAVKDLVENALEILCETEEIKSSLVEIPVSFATEFAPDLEFVSETKNLLPEKVIEIFTSRIYRVFMLGFLPGFAYLGKVDERIAVPRKDSPRVKVPKGSVGIAGQQTGIYPLESPGGWQIIGRTNLEMFTPESENPCLLQVGDLVKFIEADKIGGKKVI
ncbi:5-oxoprolinase subunit B [soil metagenome]